MPHSGDPLSDRGIPQCFPTAVEFALPVETQSNESSTFGEIPCRLELIGDGKPNWYVYDADNLTFDVAAINLTEVSTDGYLVWLVETDDQSQLDAKQRTLVGAEEFTEMDGDLVRLAAISQYVADGFPLRVGDDVFVWAFPEISRVAEGFQSGNGRRWLLNHSSR